MSLKDVPVRARLWAPDRSLPRFFGRLLLCLSDSTLRLLPSTFGRRKRAEVSLKRAALRPRAAEMRGGVAQESRAAPSGGGNARRCRSREPCCSRATKMYESVAQACCALGLRKSTKVLPNRAALHPWATISVVFVAEGFPSSIRHSALRPWATGRRGRVA